MLHIPRNSSTYLARHLCPSREGCHNVATQFQAPAKVGAGWFQDRRSTNGTVSQSSWRASGWQPRMVRTNAGNSPCFPGSSLTETCVPPCQRQAQKQLQFTLGVTPVCFRTYGTGFAVRLEKPQPNTAWAIQVYRGMERKDPEANQYARIPHFPSWKRSLTNQYLRLMK